MRYGFVLPGGSANEQIEQAIAADESGWDGVFVWEAAYGVDAWTLLGAMAQRTQRVRLGTMLTPLPWRRPWKVASQAVTLDQVSGGRAIVAIGLGAVSTDLGNTGEELDRRIRASMLDEGIDIMSGLWRGKRRFAGQRYQVDLEARADLSQVAQPVQKPAIPIWVVGAWPRRKSMRRVLRCDGLLPVAMGTNGARPEFDIIMEGETPADEAAKASELVRPWAEASCTWWIESRWQLPHESPERMQQVHQRLVAGPPHVNR
jgi:alkanesulfonate monooxygenase SsuD/methylene tetrahydromethanopterin reductase-like flavin-dependent oxidoreductase (luciferase family)